MKTKKVVRPCFTLTALTSLRRAAVSSWGESDAAADLTGARLDRALSYLTRRAQRSGTIVRV